MSFLLSHPGLGTEQLGCPVAWRSPQLFKAAAFTLSHVLFMSCPAHSEGPGSLCHSFLPKLMHLFSACSFTVCVGLCTETGGGLRHPALCSALFSKDKNHPSLTLHLDWQPTSPGYPPFFVLHTPSCMESKSVVPTEASPQP